MSRPYVSVQLTSEVLTDAGHRCGYCRTDERLTGSALTIEHIIPVAVGGLTERDNLCDHAVSVTSVRERRYERLTRTLVKLSLCTIPVRNSGLSIFAGARMAS